MPHPEDQSEATSTGRRADGDAQGLPDSFALARRAVAASPQERACESRDLLRDRLFAATLVMAVSLGAFLVRDLFFTIFQRQTAVHATTFTWLVAVLILLASRFELSVAQLRFIEFLAFGSVVAGFVASQSFGYQARMDQDLLNANEIRVLFKASILGVLILIFTYAIFIPNTCRRAAALIVPMALSPLVVPIFLGLTSGTFRHYAEEARTLDRLTENALYLLLGAGAAIYGTHIIHRCRTEAEEAKQLSEYQLMQRLGSGGMGEVHYAVHRLLKRPCAIKLIRKEVLDRPNALARFELEVRATAQLSHWNTVEVYDYGRSNDGTYFYVMEYLPGLSLQELVEQHGPLVPARVIYLLRQICEALREAHLCGLIHRDIKPPNIFAAYRGARYDVAKLLDFGLVKPTKGEDSPLLTREGMVTGSPLYMAPEQITKSHVPDARTDLYAVGAVAYFCLTGQPPFVNSDSIAVMISQVKDPVVPPSKFQKGIPTDLERVVLRCLEKEPADRYQDADSLSKALLACHDSQDWSHDRAESWWLANHPLDDSDHVPPPAVPAFTGDPEELTRVETSDPTLEAEAIEDQSFPERNG